MTFTIGKKKHPTWMRDSKTRTKQRENENTWGEKSAKLEHVHSKKNHIKNVQKRMTSDHVD